VSQNFHKSFSAETFDVDEIYKSLKPPIVVSFSASEFVVVVVVAVVVTTQFLVRHYDFTRIP